MVHFFFTSLFSSYYSNFNCLICIEKCESLTKELQYIFCQIFDWFITFLNVNRTVTETGTLSSGSQIHLWIQAIIGFVICNQRPFPTTCLSYIINIVNFRFWFVSKLKFYETMYRNLVFKSSVLNEDFRKWWH